MIQCADECLTVVGVPLWGRNLSYLYKSGKYFDRFDKIRKIALSNLLYL